MDIVDKQTRSRMMSNIKGKNTKPEIIIRSLLHREGFRFTLHDTVIFVHGCYWHRHENCKLASTPKQNKQFWLDKFDANVCRDGEVYFQLKILGWRTAVIWECGIRDKSQLPRCVKSLSLWLKTENEYFEISDLQPEME